jgi:hypothetical protein
VVVKYFKKDALNPILISLSSLFSLPHIVRPNYGLQHNNFWRINILKSAKILNIMKYYFIIYRNMLVGRTSGKSEAVRATERYTALDVWLFFTLRNYFM